MAVPQAAIAPPTDEGVLGRRLREGDSGALAELYSRHVRSVYNLALRIAGNPATAEDLTQTTFTRAFERRHTLRDPDHVRSWLLGIVYHAALNDRRDHRPAVALSDLVPTSAPSPEAAAMANAAAELVWTAAQSLEPRQAAVLDLSVRHGLDVGEVAQVVGVSKPHASVLVHRSRAALGTAVRCLLVARSANCPRLRELIPAGARRLDESQQRTVDRHLRRCLLCQSHAMAMTSPAELLSGILLLPLPAALSHGLHTTPITGAHAMATSATHLPFITRPRGLGAATGVATVVLSVSLGVARLHGSAPLAPASPPSTPAPIVAATCPPALCQPPPVPAFAGIACPVGICQPATPRPADPYVTAAGAGVTRLAASHQATAAACTPPPPTAACRAAETAERAQVDALRSQLSTMPPPPLQPTRAASLIAALAALSDALGRDLIATPDHQLIADQNVSSAYLQVESIVSTLTLYDALP